VDPVCSVCRRKAQPSVPPQREAVYDTCTVCGFNATQNPDRVCNPCRQVQAGEDFEAMTAGQTLGNVDEL